MSDERVIAFFDSGMGGLSVLKEAIKIMPHENFLFYGDSINAPYGIKSVDEVQQLTASHVDYFIKEKNAKAVVIACNTATSAAIEYLRNKYPDLIIVGLEPAVKPAVLHKKNSTIVVLATPLTLKEKKFNDLMKQYEDDAHFILLGSSALVEFVENDMMESTELYDYLKNLFEPYKNEHIDAVVLGCTHFPFVKKAILDVLGHDVIAYDGGEGASRELKKLLSLKDLLNESTEIGTITIENSGDQSSLKLAQKLLND